MLFGADEALRRALAIYGPIDVIPRARDTLPGGHCDWLID